MGDLLFKLFHKNLALVQLAVMDASMFVYLKDASRLPPPDSATTVAGGFLLGIEYLGVFAVLTAASILIAMGAAVVLDLADMLFSKDGPKYATGIFITASVGACIYAVYYGYSKSHALDIPPWMFGYISLVSLLAQASRKQSDSQPKT